jgi:hypothetical protein
MVQTNAYKSLGPLLFAFLYNYLYLKAIFQDQTQSLIEKPSFLNPNPRPISLGYR